MAMYPESSDLLACLYGRYRPRSVVSSGISGHPEHQHGVPLEKTAQAQETLADNSWKRSIQNQQQRMLQAENERTHLSRFREAHGGNADAESKYMWDRFAKASPIAQRKTQEQTAQDVAREGVGNFADSRAGKWIGKTLGTAANFWGNIGGKALGYLKNAPSGATWSDWSKEYDRTARQTSDAELGHDIANNMQKQWNHFKRGAGDVGRFIAKWGDRRTWGSSTDARLWRQHHDNKWDNAIAHTNAVDRVLDSRYNDSSLRDSTQGIGRWNNIGNGIVGELAGGTVATAGIGTAAKGVGSGISAGARFAGQAAGAGTTNALRAAANVRGIRPVVNGIQDFQSRFGSTARNLEASRVRHVNALTRAGADPSRVSALASPESYRQAYLAGIRGGGEGARRWAMQAGRSAPLPERIGGMVNRGIVEMGRTAAMPFNAVGAVSSPSALTGSLKNVSRPMIQAGRAALQPVFDMAGAIRNPAMTARRVGAKLGYYPVRSTWNAITSPVRYGYRVLKPVFPMAMRAQAAGVAGSKALSGDFGGAAGEIGMMGAFGAGAVPGIAAMAGSMYLNPEE